MNEWSPGGNFSRPGTPIQATGRQFRSQWEDSEKSARPLVVNIRAVSDKNKSFQQQSLEDMSKSSISISSKTKKLSYNGVSDPRFKRVISTSFQNDNLGTEIKLGKTTANQPEDDTIKFKNSDCSAASESKSSQLWGSMVEIKEAAKSPSVLLTDENLDSNNLTQIESTGCGQAHDHLKAVEKLTFNYDTSMKSASKESLSDCTVNTRNTSLASDDLLDDAINNELSVYPSATRVKKVQHWIQDQKPKIEKKQSVITVIGQMQGQDTLNSALREIDKRRKLVKELDKYAICSKITDSDKEKEISHLITKISYLSSSKNLCADNLSIAYAETLSKEPFICDGSGDKIENNLPPNETILNNFKIKEMDSSQSVRNNGKRSATRKKVKKSHLSHECLVKGKIKEILNFSQYHWIFYTLILISGVFCWIMFSTFNKNSYTTFDFFNKKPKTMSWYEKICMWLWEFFRPSGNYKRNTPWNGY